MDSKKKILIILGIIFSVTLTYRIMHPYRQKTVSQLTFINSKGYTKINKNKSVLGYKQSFNIPDVMLDYFFNPPEHSAKVYKNIFFKEETIKTDVNLASVISKQDSPVKKINNDISKLKIFGSYKTLYDNAIFFEHGEQVLVIREGDKIDGRFLVKKISQQDVSLKVEDDLVRIDLEDF